jgi:MerR family transcriptional regulator, light-induced transcriptional regulator
MQAVCNETGVPADTLRSWERRYGFPEPARTDSNRRLYSQRDIAAVTWLREQTERGQGISEAIAMLRRILQAETTPAPITRIQPRPAPAATPEATPTPDQTFIEALLKGDLPAAQSAWDRLSLTISPEALCGEIVIPAQARLREGTNGAARLHATDFLQRKVMVLFDHSSPDRGTRDIVLMIDDPEVAEIPAYALATVLSRYGYRIALPLLDVSDAAAALALGTVQPTTPAVIVGPASQNALLDGYIALLPNVRFLRWWHEPTSPAAGDNWLPTAILAVPGALPD